MILLLIQIFKTYAEKCRVLAFEGGGTKGAYEAGAVSAIVKNT
jgi:predicted acylesterase/phospholipase RssA